MAEEIYGPVRVLNGRRLASLNTCHGTVRGPGEPEEVQVSIPYLALNWEDKGGGGFCILLGLYAGWR